MPPRNSTTDEDILTAIREFDGVPTPKGLFKYFKSNGFSIDRLALQNRLSSDTTSSQEMQTRGNAYLGGLSDQDLFKRSSAFGWVRGLPEYAKKLLYLRMDQIFEREIQQYPGVPTAEGLSRFLKSKKLSISDNTISIYSPPDSSLDKKMQAKGEAYIDSLSDKDLFKKFNTRGWVHGFPEYAKQRVYARIDLILLTEIQQSQGILTAESLSESLSSKERSLSAATVCKRLDPELPSSKVLSNAIQAKGEKYIYGLPNDELFKKYCSVTWMGNLPEYAKKIVNARLDLILLNEIQQFQGLPTILGICDILRSKGFNTTRKTIRDRLDQNLSLWIAYYTKKGLTEDQAVELALERNEASESMTAVLRKRLENLHAFREMIGVIQCFSDVLKGQVLEVSLYPEPLKRAAELLGSSFASAYERMQPFRKSQEKGPTSLSAQSADVVVLQSIHRLASEGLTRLFEEVHRVLNEGGVVIATHSTDYMLTEPFIPSLQSLGFELKHQGILQIEAPSANDLIGLGVAPDEVTRIRAKIAGESAVLVFTRLADSNSTPVQIPALVKSVALEGNGIAPEASVPGADIPLAVSKQITSTFLAQASGLLPESPLLVEIEHNGKVVALVGYNMNPKHRGRIESAKYPGAPAEDYRAIARRIAHNTELRTGLGVKPNDITRVPLSKLRGR
jgi:hypothetical protein